MQMCQRHWDMMRAEIEDLGLSGWVAPDGQTAVEQLVDQMRRDEVTPVNYDPLMAAHNAILGRVIEGLGLVVMSPDYGCPICDLNSRRDDDGFCTCGHADCPNQRGRTPMPDFESWLHGPDSAPAAIKAHMVEQGWVA